MNPSMPVKVYGFLRTNVCTTATADTFIREKGELHPWVLRLRILTENTLQRASFKEYHTADTRTIFETVPFNVYNKRKSVHL
jgi:hypothetical protein